MQKSETNNNTSSVNKIVTENDEILETEIRNFSPSSNSKQKRETQTEHSSKKKKIVLTGDMVNDISEKGFSVKLKVKIVNFPDGTSEKILEKQYDIIKEQPDDLIVHAGTDNLTDNVNLLNLTKILQKSSVKFLKNRHRDPLRFHLSLTAKTRRTSRKP